MGIGLKLAADDLPVGFRKVEVVLCQHGFHLEFAGTVAFLEDFAHLRRADSAVLTTVLSTPAG
jgi:hypothetical protein